MPNTLDLEEDDDAELAVTLEEAFDFKFDRKNAEMVENVGELFDIVVGKLARAPDLRKCATAMIFYRLRRALRQIEPEKQFTPSLSLTEFKRLTAKQLFALLRKSTGLNTPRTDLTWLGLAGSILFLLALASIFLVFVLVAMHVPDMYWGWLIPLCIVAGLILIWADQGRLPKDCMTLGDLAVKMSVLNYGRMIKLGARADEVTLWNVFTILLAEYSSLPKEDIRRDTLFQK